MNVRGSEVDIHVLTFDIAPIAFSFFGRLDAFSGGESSPTITHNRGLGVWAWQFIALGQKISPNEVSVAASSDAVGGKP
jgi:hypothetical protein